ncbi:unnamed protein product [Arabis nemorensis]|uniref:UBC core domain-containing protein n=1 Tax=Arabis nemorensis TaxID=586526 RepID=A0A565CI84_9BRAS|nr:unnamed protein product [Arabis nemorensis]
MHVSKVDKTSKLGRLTWNHPNPCRPSLSPPSSDVSGKEDRSSSYRPASNENLPTNVIKQLAKELKSLDEPPPDDIKIVVNDEDFSQICADIEGPVGTPYENGLFRMKLALSPDFLHLPPKGMSDICMSHLNIGTSEML